MKYLKSLVFAVAMTFGLAGTAQAAAEVAAPPVAVAATATPAATVEGAAPTAAPAFDYAKPVDGIGQPVSGAWRFQPQVTEVGHDAVWLNDVILLPLITVISLFVLGLLLWVIVRFRSKVNPIPSKTSHNTFIEIVWTLVPVLILVAVAVPSISLLAKQYRPADKDAVVIKVTGYQWNWGYAYPDYAIGEYISKMLDKKSAEERGEPYQLAADQRLVVPVGRQVKLLITGADVIHSFAVPALWTKMDAVPGRTNETTFTALKAGVYYGQCSELCGIDHGYMPIAVEAVPADKFDAWVLSKGGKLPSAVAAETVLAPTASPTTAPAPAAAATPAAAPAAATN